MNDYRFTVKNMLTTSDVARLRSKHFPDLVSLNARYAPEIDLTKSMPVKPEYLDVIRTSWLLDKAAGRPAQQIIVSGLGFGLGALLAHLLEMRWAQIIDKFGESFSMLGRSSSNSQISVPPFSYVEKKGEVQNAEVFIDLFNLLREKFTQ